MCRLLHHISLTEALHVQSGQAERSLAALAPLTILAGRTLCLHPSSRIARENLEVALTCPCPSCGSEESVSVRCSATRGPRA